MISSLKNNETIPAAINTIISNRFMPEHLLCHTNVFTISQFFVPFHWLLLHRNIFHYTESIESASTNRFPCGCVSLTSRNISVKLSRTLCFRNRYFTIFLGYIPTIIFLIIEHCDQLMFLNHIMTSPCIKIIRFLFDYFYPLSL